VQLLESVNGLGEYGTLQSVAPGYMRNTLFPLGKARYLGAGPQLMAQAGQSGDTIDQTLSQRLKSLPEIVLERNARNNAINERTSDSLLYKPITLQHLTNHLQEVYDVKHLHPPYAVLEVASDRSGATRLASTGRHVVKVHLRTGEDVLLQVRIQRTYIAADPPVAT